MELNTKNSLQYYAMQFGTYLGILWIIKFPLYPMGLRYPIFQLLFMALTVAAPFVAYYYVRMYRDKVCGGSIRFLNAWVFTMLMYMFAALLTAVEHYIYFRYIDNGYIGNSLSAALHSMKGSQVLSQESMSLFLAAIDDFCSLSPIKQTLQLISQNVIYGNILSLITALFVMKRPK